ncbi:MAG: ribonucleotide-diphosphate reductase subunit beta, partial [Alphaproteobacteria bacterium]|nr:ribonucleotide-diphosphate reductase subunit beta [Alphaproteobacteria bacterium]
MSVNYGNVDPRSLIGTGKIGLLKSTGTYDISRYGWAYDCWKRQQQTHWMGEEVPLGADIKDWQSGRLAPAEKNLLTQIFRFFTQSDVEVGDNYLKRYIPIFQPLEVQMMMAAFSNMETVHIDAYALLLKTLGMPQAEFEAFRDYDAMRAKADYMHSFGTRTCSDVARTLAMFGAFTEGMALFASFAMLLNFPRHNKMNGMGQIVSWSVRDESLHCEGIARLYHAWNEETGAVTKAVRDDIIDVAKTMVGLE